jgi:hypothetical protein
MYPNTFEPPSSSGGGAARVRTVVSCIIESTSAPRALSTNTGAVCMREGGERLGVTIGLLAALVGATAYERQRVRTYWGQDYKTL